MKRLFALVLLATLLVSGCLAARAAPLSGDVEFDFTAWSGPAVPVRVYVPGSATPASRIVVVLHGASRDAPRYYADWRAEAERHGFIVVVPYFSKALYPGSAHYNLGHVFDPATGALRPRERWTFAAIEPLFDAVVEKLGSAQPGYTVFGHSAGSQFLHRFLYFVPDARVTRAIAANAGWYTMPDFGVNWPYGLGDSGVDPGVLEAYFGRDLVVLLGDADVVREDEDLRKSPEAELQGAHRYARGQTFYRVAAARARELDVEFGWRLQVVPGAAHSNAQMTPAAAALINE